MKVIDCHGFCNCECNPRIRLEFDYRGLFLSVEQAEALIESIKQAISEANEAVSDYRKGSYSAVRDDSV